MHAHVALSAALILGLAATASAQRLRGRANVELLGRSPGPLPSVSGFEQASHRRSLRDTSEIQQKVVAALRNSVAKGSNPQLAAAQALADAAIRSDGALTMHRCRVTSLKPSGPLPAVPLLSGVQSLPSCDLIRRSAHGQCRTCAGTTPPPPLAALTVAAPTAAVPSSAKVTTDSASGGALSVGEPVIRFTTSTVDLLGAGGLHVATKDLLLVGLSPNTLW